MPIAIFLRRSVAENHFRRCLIGALTGPHGERAWISSGFFQERPSFTASGQAGLIAGARRLRSVTAIGVYNGMWLKDYESFCTALISGGVKLTALKARGLRWHAKVFVLATRRRPLFALLGSSNMTRSAFGVSVPFNWESDVAIWTERNRRVSNFFERMVVNRDVLGDVGMRNVIVADYDPKKNDGLTVDDRLSILLNDLVNMPAEPLSP